MDPKNIQDGEMLYRAIKQSYPEPFVLGKPSPALFIDKNGLSVSRDGGRAEDEVIQALSRKFVNKEGKSDYSGCLKISAKDCREVPTYPMPKPTQKDPYHAEIHDSEFVIEISLKKAILLSMACTVL